MAFKNFASIPRTVFGDDEEDTSEPIYQEVVTQPNSSRRSGTSQTSSTRRSGGNSLNGSTRGSTGSSTGPPKFGSTGSSSRVPKFGSTESSTGRPKFDSTESSRKNIRSPRRSPKLKGVKNVPLRNNRKGNKKSSDESTGDVTSTQFRDDDSTRGDVSSQDNQSTQNDEETAGKRNSKGRRNVKIGNRKISNENKRSTEEKPKALTLAEREPADNICNQVQVYPTCGGCYICFNTEKEMYDFIQEYQEEDCTGNFYNNYNRDWHAKNKRDWIDPREMLMKIFTDDCDEDSEDDQNDYDLDSGNFYNNYNTSWRNTNRPEDYNINLAKILSELSKCPCYNCGSSGEDEDSSDVEYDPGSFYNNYNVNWRTKMSDKRPYVWIHDRGHMSKCIPQERFSDEYDDQWSSQRRSSGQSGQNRSSGQSGQNRSSVQSDQRRFSNQSNQRRFSTESNQRRFSNQSQRDGLQFSGQR